MVFDPSIAVNFPALIQLKTADIETSLREALWQ
jgi:hypothetical protein